MQRSSSKNDDDAGGRTGEDRDAAIETTAGAQVPLVVDVDGTLIKSDILYETALQFMARSPLEIWKLPLWLSRGKSVLKAELAAFGDHIVDTIPLREETVALIHAAQAEGCPVYLASASDHRLVGRLSERIGGISGVFATEGSTNLAGEAKASRLVKAFGEQGFDYVGDGPVDVPVWRAARRALVVAHSASFERRVLSDFPDARVVTRAPLALRDILRAMRPHQWAKNSLVFLGLVAGHRFSGNEILLTFIAFCCFCMAASSAYILNDLLDLPGDRAHRSKHRRPFASGALPIPFGLALSAALGGAAFALSFTLPTKFSVILLIYMTATLSYSFYFKRKLVADIVVLAGLYTLRVMGGISALGFAQTQWILMFSLFLFGSLAIVKRCSELIAMRAEGKEMSLGRGYRTEDLNVLLSCGAAAGYGAILVFALYLYSPEVRSLYAHPDRLWLICPLLMYWISRIFILSNRNHLHEDPVVFALTDRNSLMTGCCAAAVLAASL
jgi:4-hydroxybenzoate polyprenyltransferase/phosphoserine phosphatase